MKQVPTDCQLRPTLIFLLICFLLEAVWNYIAEDTCDIATNFSVDLLIVTAVET